MVRFPSPSIRFPLLALAVVLLAGCQTNTYNVKVNAITNEDKRAEGSSYRIVTKNGGDPRTDLRTREAVEYVKAALSGRGKRRHGRGGGL